MRLHKIFGTTRRANMRFRLSNLPAVLSFPALTLLLVGCSTIGELSKNPTDSAGRFNILYPFRGLTPQGKQERELAALKGQNEINQQRRNAEQYTSQAGTKDNSFANSWTA